MQKEIPYQKHKKIKTTQPKQKKTNRVSAHAPLFCVACLRTVRVSGKGSGDKSSSQQNSDAARNAKFKEFRSEDPGIKEKVKTVTELTGRTEEEACFALHEYQDINQAVNMLIEIAESVSPARFALGAFNVEFCH